MPSWALSKFHTATYTEGMECEDGADMQFDDLVFVIDGVDYAIPSHHWNSREIDTKLAKGGRCFSTISALDISQDGQENLFILGD